MQRSAPKIITWIIALILGVLGILMHTNVVIIPALTPYEFWVETAAWGVLAVGTILPGV